MRLWLLYQHLQTESSGSQNMFSGKVEFETSIMTRIKRLLQKVKKAFQSNFARGAGFGAIDVVVGI